MARRETHSADRILQKSLELFSRKGYGPTSVREICDAASVTKPTLYHFFGSKEGLFRALIGGALEEFRQELGRRVESPGTTAEKLKRVARAYFEAGMAHRELVRFILGLAYGPPSGTPATDFHSFYHHVADVVARAVDEGVAAGELTPGSTALRMFVLLGAIGEALSGYLFAGRPELTPALADSLIDSILAGWCPHPEKA